MLLPPRFSHHENAAAVSIPTTALIPYYGRAGTVPRSDALRVATHAKVVALKNEFDKSTTSLTAVDLRGVWNQLRADLDQVEKNLASDEGLEVYRLEIFSEVVIPYLEDMKSRFHVNQGRIDQLKSLLTIISHCAPVRSPVMRDNGVSDMQATDHGWRGSVGTPVDVALHREHPAEVLMKIDDLLMRVQSGLWTSQMQKLLTTAANKQWRPILRDNQLMLKNVGNKLIGLGLAELLGRPLLMLYPIYMITMSALRVVDELNVKRQPGPDTYVQIIKGLLMLWGSTRLMNLLSAFQGLGITCLILGCVAYAVAMNDTFTKIAAPLISHHFVRVDGWVSVLSSFEQNSFSALSGFILQTKQRRAASSSSSADTVTGSGNGSARFVDVDVSLSELAKTTTAPANDESTETLDMRKVLEVGQGITAAVVGVSTAAEARERVNMLVQAASEYIHTAADTFHSGITKNEVNKSNEGKATVEEIVSANDNVNIAETMDLTKQVGDDDYDIPSLEELETMTGYQAQVANVNADIDAEGCVLRHRRMRGSEN